MNSVNSSLLNLKFVLSIFALCVFTISRPALASVVSTTGQVDVVAMPTNFNLYASTLNNGRGEIFSEVVGHIIPNTYPGANGYPPSAEFDISTAGTFSGAQRVPLAIKTGWIISSYLFHWAPSDNSSLEKKISGSVSFDREILGLSAFDGLQSTPFFMAFGLPNINLQSSSFLELCAVGDTSPTCDSITVSHDLKTIEFALSATVGTDDFRVFFLDGTVPEPSTFLLVIAALGCIVIFRRRGL